MIYAENRKAKHDYEALSKHEGGLLLEGGEVKSIREGGAKLSGAYLQIVQGELWVIGMHIGPYSKHGTKEVMDPTRRRKVLVQKKELNTLIVKTQQKGLTLVPFSLYTSGRRIKVSFGVCRGRKLYDKREQIKKRELKRHMERE